mmetsp:Transcript_33268/g.32705  ORF Transcript_33268/g.32705 Transcript_33268/m.32705 type:complete len:547 (-) Transcript_33268:112-1752(-)
MHYCDFDERMYATIPLLILILLLAFYALGSTADAYLTPALEKVSTTLKMSESLAGVTLLALGNGAPDVIASISAADGAEGGMFFSVGALTGSGIFVTGVVSAVVILSSKKEIKVLGIHMFRDIGFYVLGLVVLVIAAIVGELNIFFAAAFILIYVAYVVTVVIMDTLEKRARKAGASKGMRATFVEENEEDEEEAYFYQDSNDRIVEIERIEQRKTVQDGDPQRFRISLNNQDKESFRSGTSYTESLDSEKNGQHEKKEQYNINGEGNLAKSYTSPMVPRAEEISFSVNENNGKKHDLSEGDRFEKEPALGKLDETNAKSIVIEDHVDEINASQRSNDGSVETKGRMRRGAEKVRRKVVWSMLKMKKFMKTGIQGEESWEEMSVLKKIIFVLVDTPLNFVRKLTIPPADGEQWDRNYAALSPFFSIAFVYIIVGLIDFKTVPHLSFWILQGIAFTLSVLICFLTPKNHGPRRTMVIFSVFAFIMSIVWIYFLAGILVDTVALLGVILRFPPTFLAITMLAWGNAIGDVMANSAFAKKGLAKMALTA